MATEAAFNPVLLDVPDHVETERLLLRAPRPGDGAMVNASVIETLEDLRQYPASMLWAMEEQPVEKTEEFCRRAAANWIIRADFPILLFRRDTGEHAGNCGLHRFNWDTRVFEIGWWGRKGFQGQGLIFRERRIRRLVLRAIRNCAHFMQPMRRRPVRHLSPNQSIIQYEHRQLAVRNFGKPTLAIPRPVALARRLH